MGKGLFITGTGTDVGKTYVSALIVKKLRDAGFRSGYFKAAASGSQRTQSGLAPEDAEYVKAVAGIGGKLSEMVPYAYEHAYSPHLAAQIEGNPVEMDVVCGKYEAMLERYEYVTVEGSGGIVCPIRFDTQVILLEDVIKKLNLGVLAVADSGLGAINRSVLTVSYLRSREIEVKGIVLNRFRDSIVEMDNRKMIEYLTGVPVVAALREGEMCLDIGIERLAGFYDE